MAKAPESEELVEQDEDEEDEAPPLRKSKPKGPESVKANGTKLTLAEQRAQRTKQLAQLTMEYNLLRNDSGNAAVNRRMQIAQEMKECSRYLYETEEEFDFRVPKSVTGEPFQIGSTQYPPGMHRVKASVAQTLAEMIDKNQAAERRRMTQNGRNLDLGEIGTRIRHADIGRDD